MTARRRSSADIDPEQYRIPRDAPDGGTVPLEDEFEQADIDRIVTEVRRRGRPSLTAPGRQSPVLRVRVPETLRQRVDETANAQGRIPAQLLRDAIEEYLDRHSA